MKLQDKETLSVADTVKDVLEGKKVVKEMDPKKHVSKEDDKFVVKNSAGDVVKSFDDEEEATKYAADNHDDLMKEAVSKEGNAFGKAVMAAKDKGDKTFMFAGKKYDVTTKEEVKDDEEDDEDKEDEVKESKTVIEDLFDVEEAKTAKTEEEDDEEDDEDEEDEVDEMSDKQKKYQAFFNKALKKFKVKSPAELKGDAKKDFFDYVDKNYEAEGEKAESHIVIDPNHPVLVEKKVKVDVDWIGDPKATKDAEKKFKIKIKVNKSNGTADVSGDNKQIMKMLMDPDVYGWDKRDIIDTFPSLK